MPKIAVIAAARPNFMKVAPILRSFEARGIEAELIHTGQHYDQNMSEVFFADLGIRPPHVNLGVGSGTHAEQTAAVMVAYERYVESCHPSWTLVVGDVNSTIACALVAAKCGSKVCHVEAGLRSGDWSMPEEINRVVTDRLSDLCLTPSKDADANLLAEGIDPARIVCVGNVMIDTLFRLMPLARKSNVHSRLGVERGEYLLVTMHRPGNVDDISTLKTASEILIRLAERLDVIFPVHPRTRVSLVQHGLWEALKNAPKLKLCDPLGYLDFIALMANARIVLTDSGGIQEETTILEVPCLTMRESTERPITVEQGTNEIVGLSKERILDTVDRILLGCMKSAKVPPLWDGKAAERIGDLFLRMKR